MARTSTTELADSAAAATSRALAHLGFDSVSQARDDSGGIALEVAIDDRSLAVSLGAMAYGTAAQVAELIGSHRRDGRVRMLVADKITADARAQLSEAGWSWFDRRGRLHFSGKGVRIDVDVPADPRPVSGSSARDPIAGPGGLAVAYWLCAHPGEAVSPTGLAPVLGFAPSTISTANRRLVDAGLVGDDGAGLFPELFWELAEVWRPLRVWLATVPAPPAPAIDPASQRWCRAGTTAAAAYGAPVVSAEDGPVELYVSGPIELDIATRRYHPAPPGSGAASVAVAPVRAVTTPPGDGTEVPVVEGWPAAPKLAIALDLAQDQARGRQILEEWEVEYAVWR